MLAVLAATAAHAQCTNLNTPAPPAPGSTSKFTSTQFLPPGIVLSGVQSLVSVLTTQNTSFLTQTSGFIGAPANPAAETPGGGAWVRGLGGTFDTRTPGSFQSTPNNAALLGGGVSGVCNLRTFQDFSGYQAGADISKLNINGFNIHGGVTVGYSEADLRSNSAFRANFQTPFVGVYGAVTKGNFFADGQIRWDFFQGTLNQADATLFNQRLDARSLSLTGNVGYQIPLNDGFFVEPSAGAVYSQVKVDSFAIGGGIFPGFNSSPGTNSIGTAPTTTKINDFESVLARASIRAGKNILVGDYVLQPFITASVINEFAGAVRSTATTNLDAYNSVVNAVISPGSTSPSFDTTARLRTGRIGTYGQFSGGIAGQILNTGWLGYLRGDYRTGDRVDGWGVSAGLRYQFNPAAAARALISKGEAPVVAAFDGPVNWTGFSAGVSAGGLWSQTNQSVRPSGNQLNQVNPLFPFTIPSIATLPFITDSASASIARPHDAGVYVGGQIGADYQFGQFVVGVAGDGGFTNARGGRNCSSGLIGNFYSCQTNIDDVFMATARVGYALERSLFYVKGGAAFADTTDRTVSNFGNQPIALIAFGVTPVSVTLANSRVHDLASGWTIGAGFEYAITKNIFAKAEYMHYELDRRNYVRGTPTNQGILSTQHTGDLVKVGVNYRFTFDPPVVVAPRPVIAKY